MSDWLVWERRGKSGTVPHCALADRFEVRAVCEQVGMRAQQAARDFGATAIDGFRAWQRGKISMPF